MLDSSRWKMIVVGTIFPPVFHLFSTDFPPPVFFDFNYLPLEVENEECNSRK